MFNRPVTLQVCYASKSEDANQRTTSQEVFFKNLDALYRFIRPYGLMGTVIAITSVSLLPLQNLDDLTPTYFMGFLKAMVPGLLMTVYEFAINQLYDVKIDKINKPDLPLTSGDVSMRTGIAIASSSLLVSLAMGIMLRSPPLLLALIIWFLLASAYSVDKYVLGRQIAITRTLMFAVAIKCCFCFVISLLKDIPDEDGDREFGIQTPSVILGKESVSTLALRLCAAYILWSRYYSRINFFTIPAEQTCHVVGVVFFCLVDYGYKGNSKVVQPLSILEDDEEVVSLDKSNCDAEEKANAELSGGCLFKFNSDGDKKKVFVGGPLSFKNVIIALTEPKGVRDLAKLYLTHASFYVQIHNVPISCMNEEIKKGKDKKEYENVPDHGSLPSVGSKRDNLVTLGNHDISIASEAFNKFGDEAIPEKDNSWETNLRFENKSVTGSIGLLN
ncbi:homogentisate geranylgeranyltransferase [Citrus sinensis]|uniref:Homogentisate geranylgeranyltransferase n=1 Tax=Citrus sinensis TaxID=2711 RepID=A0ACB8N1L9_CITSI|nr:homogentisate geranylgeranyltransferase [Citrus sinensis]